ncbi:hypothetical protein LguiB_013826 [Lonicera macranthoides]
MGPESSGPVQKFGRVYLFSPLQPSGLPILASIEKAAAAEALIYKFTPTYFIRSSPTMTIDTDFGYHELLYGEEFYWKFHKNILARTFVRSKGGGKKTRVSKARPMAPSSFLTKLRSSDTDFGYHDLARGEEFYWKFQSKNATSVASDAQTLKNARIPSPSNNIFHSFLSLDTANKKARGLLDFIDQLEIPLPRTIFIFTSKVIIHQKDEIREIQKNLHDYLGDHYTNTSSIRSGGEGRKLGFPKLKQWRHPLFCLSYSTPDVKVDTDFGYHELLRGEEFYWKFHNHVFEKTLYFCHFYWGNMDKVFDVFNDRKAFPSCADGITTQEGKCYWLVKNDGFYSCKDKCEPNNLSQWNKTSKDNDLGNHDLQRNEEFYWKFHIHVFGRTLYFCHFYWGDIDKSVDVFNDKKRFPSCDDDKSPKVAKPQPRNIYPHGFVSGSSRPASQGVTHPGISLVHYSLNFRVLMGSEAIFFIFNNCFLKRS